MTRTYKPVVISLDPKHEGMLNVLVQERAEGLTSRSALVRRLIAREFRSHLARKRITSRKPSPEGESPNEQ